MAQSVPLARDDGHQNDSTCAYTFTHKNAQHQNDSTCEYLVCTLSNTNVHEYGHHWFNLHIYNIHVHVCVHFLTKVCDVVMVVEMSSKRFKLHLANCNQQSNAEHSGVRAHLFVFVHCNLGTPRRTKSSVFLNIVQTAFDPPPLVFEHLCCGLYRVIWRQIAPRSIQNLQQFFLTWVLPHRSQANPFF